MKNYDYGLIGNCTSAALVNADCSIDWLCLPFFDSPSLFARILDEKKGGHFKITGVDILRTSQNYVYHTAILKTTFETKDGIFEVSDYMPRFTTSLGGMYCPSEIQRDIHVISGTPKVIIEFFPRPHYAANEVLFIYHEDFLKITSPKESSISFYLYSNLDFKKIVAAEPLELKESSYLLLSYHEKLEPIDLYKIYVEYEKTKSYWLGWSFRTKLPARYKDIVVRSTITLKLLTYERTGAVIAAPTTSLPEIIGKNRNWDYRFCWVRDASMIIDLYARLGHLRLGERFLGFILNRMLLKNDNIAVMYGINGERNLEEKTLEYLSGYENSQPVRIGNDAYRQKQNDLAGALIETIYTYFFTITHEPGYLDEEIWTVVRTLVNEVTQSWQEPDSGIWERRGPPEHYVHSKMMNWVAMDRAGKIAKFLGKTAYSENCFLLAAKIKADILVRGWSEKKQAFTMAYGTENMDAANLLMLHYGFLKPDDPRMISTVRQTYKDLAKNNLLFRYTAEDDFGVPENAFIVCTFWMINAMYLIGEEKKAREMFENIMSCANRHGLFSEDVEMATRRLTGNFPQGYSHLAFVQTVLLLETAYNWSDAFKDRADKQ